MKALFRWGNLILFVAMVVVNALANIIPIGGKTTGEVSADYPTLLTPASYAFSIWGVIYILMGFFAIFVAVTSEDDDTISIVRDSIGIFFLLSCMMNIAWLFAWHYGRIGLSTIFILGLLLTLIVINMRFTIYPGISIPARICVYGFNIYLGWISAASILNISVLLKKVKWTGFGLSDYFWSLLILLAIVVLGICFMIFGGRFMSSLALMWAVAGMFVRHISATGYNNAYPMLIITLACVFILILSSVVLAPFICCFPEMRNNIPELFDGKNKS